MSNEALTWAFKQDVKPMAAKFVLVVLADYADEHHSCFPSQKTIAARVGSSVETVRRALKVLAAEGIISREMRSRDDGSRSSDRFYLTIQSEGGSPQIEGGSPQIEGRVPSNSLGGSPQDRGDVNPQLTLKEEKQRESDASASLQRSRAVSLPASFQVTDAMSTWALSKAQGIDLGKETEKFKNFHLSKGSKFKDWTAAWRNWILNAAEYKARDDAKSAASPPLGEWWPGG